MKTPSEVISEWFERVWTNNEAEFIDEGLAESCDVSGLDAETITTREGFHLFHQMINAAFENIEVTVDQLIEHGDECSGVVSVHAVHKESGLDVCFKSSFFGTVRDGRIYKAVNLVDYLGLLIQLGSLPPDVLPRGLSGQSAL